MTQHQRPGFGLCAFSRLRPQSTPEGPSRYAEGASALVRIEPQYDVTWGNQNVQPAERSVLGDPARAGQGCAQSDEDVLRRALGPLVIPTESVDTDELQPVNRGEGRRETGLSASAVAKHKDAAALVGRRYSMQCPLDPAGHDERSAKSRVAAIASPGQPLKPHWASTKTLR